MSSYLIETDGRLLVNVQDQLQKYLPGLDARLFALSDRRALLRGHLLEALSTEYSSPREVWLKVLGIRQLQPLTDEQTLGVLQGRDPSDLPRLRASLVTQVDGLDWHLTAVRAAAAWKKLGGPDRIDWGETKVAHLDTGYTRHPALGFLGATWVDVTGAQTNMPPPPTPHPKFDPDEPGNGLDPVQGFSGGHGTRMAGTICGWAPDAEGGAFYGVAPKVPCLPIRVTDAVWVNHAQRQMAQALDYASTIGRARVVNISLGIFGAVVVKELRQALDRAYEAGVIVVCAAGNHVDPVVAPARLSRTVAVAGVTSELCPWSGSSFGPEVDFSAPAADVRRANVDRRLKFSYSGGGDGTSYATAITSGAAALWLTLHSGKLAATYSERWCIVEAFSKLARDTAYVPKGIHWESGGAFGKGILDIEALLDAYLPRQEELVKASFA